MDERPTLDYSPASPRIGRAGQTVLCVIALLIAVPPLAFLAVVGAWGVYAYYPRNYTDALEPWRLGFMSLASLLAGGWVVWRVVKTLRRGQH